MLAQGTPLYRVSDALEHTNITVAKDVFSHLVKGETRTAAGAISAAIFPASNGDAATRRTS